MSRPDYDAYTNMELGRGRNAAAFALQILRTCQPWLTKDWRDLSVLDVGCGYGHTDLTLAEHVGEVVGIEPMEDLYFTARKLGEDIPNLSFRLEGVGDLDERDRYDLVILDNVYEHLPDQQDALRRCVDALRPGGVLYLLMPNKLWPIEAHYRLPFLAWLPLSAANRYLRLSGRGDDYTDASYAPTYWRLARALDSFPELEWRMTLPADQSATQAGSPVHYRLGMAALGRVPALWAISKAFLVVARKR